MFNHNKKGGKMKETAILIICLLAFGGCILLIYYESQKPPTELSKSDNPGDNLKPFYDQPVGLPGKEPTIFKNKFEKPLTVKGSFFNKKNASLNRLSRHTLRQPKKEVSSNQKQNSNKT